MDKYKLRFSAEKNGTMYMDYAIDTVNAPPKELARFRQSVSALLTEITRMMKAAELPRGNTQEKVLPLDAGQGPIPLAAPDSPIPSASQRPTASAIKDRVGPIPSASDQAAIPLASPKPTPPASGARVRYGVKGLLHLECPVCKERFWRYTHVVINEEACRCGQKINLDALAYFEAICPDCGMRMHGYTNTEDATMQCKCNKCGKMLDMAWSKHTRGYLGVSKTA